MNYVAVKPESYRIEVATLCDGRADNGLRCPKVALNAVQRGHDGKGRPYISYYCDDCDKKRLA